MIVSAVEARLENQLVDLRRRQCLTRTDEAFAHRFCEDPFRVESGAIVLDRDDDVAALVVGAERQPSIGSLPGLAAALGILDAVVHAVANHVHQRVVDVLDNAPIELGVFAREDELDRLPRFLGEVADESCHLLERLADGHHAHRHGVLLQVTRDPFQLRQVPGQSLVGGHQQRRIFLEDRLRDDELADHVHEVVELARVHLDRCLAGDVVHAPSRRPAAGRSRFASSGCLFDG